MPLRSLVIQHRIYPIRGLFRISRGFKTQSDAVVVSIRQGGQTGWGECIPYTHYSESVNSVMDQIREVGALIEEGLGIDELQSVLPPGAARNALDCALWDLRSRLSGVSASAQAGLGEPLKPMQTAFTLSLDTPEAMARAAKVYSDLPILKLKLGGDGDDERVAAVRTAAPAARLIADANESWSIRHLRDYLPHLARLGVELLEQPLPAGADEALFGFSSPVPLAADESCRHSGSIADLIGKYAYANIKLDKTGGLTEALHTVNICRDAGLKIMVGCMVGSSLSMAPGIVLAQLADIVHLDGPLLLTHDHFPALRYEGALVTPDLSVWSI